MTTCPVCLEDCESPYLTICNHGIHSECLIEWMKRGNKTCPTCRQSLNGDDIEDTKEESSDDSDDSDDDVNIRTSFRVIRRMRQRRLAYLRRKAAAGNASSILQHSVRGLRNAEERLKTSVDKVRDLHREHSDIFKAMNKARSHCRLTHRYIRNWKGRLLDLDDDELTRP